MYIYTVFPLINASFFYFKVREIMEFINVWDFQILSFFLSKYVMLCYVEFITIGNLQFCNDSTIASLEANQNRPKIKYYVNK